MAALYEGCSIVQIFSILAVVGFMFLRNPDALAFSLPHIVHGEVHRVFLSTFVFADMGQTFYGLMLLYAVRQFERLMGFSKFGGFAAVALMVSIAMNLATTLLLSSIDYVPQPGPYFLIYGMLYLYYVHIPRLHASKYTVLNLVVFSEKTWVYLLALHLSLCAGLESFIPALTGLALGALYHRVPALQRQRLPAVAQRVASACGAFFNRIFPPAAPRAAASRRPPVGGDGFGEERGRGGGGGGGGGPMPMPSAPPPEESVAMLMQLGVDRATALTALRNSNNDVERAANMVLR